MEINREGKRLFTEQPFFCARFSFHDNLGEVINIRHWGPCIDLFCGAGGLSCGFAQAGFDIRLGVDLDASALLTFERNHPHALVVKADVTQLTGAKLRELAGNQNIFGIIGGPPCQGFSFAGKHDPNDVRNQLPYEYARLLEEVRPAFFLMENVKGLLSKKQRVHFDAIRELFSAAGYRLDWRLLNAWDYRVAQTRERVFIVGFRTDVEVVFNWPTPDPMRPLLRDAIGDLPNPVRSDEAMMNHTLSIPRPASMENRLRNAGKGVAMFDCKVQDWEQPCKTVTAHLAKDVDLAHPGLPPNHSGHLFSNAREESRYDQTNRRASLEDPSFTITAQSRSAGLHPNHGPVPSDPKRILDLVSQADVEGVIPVKALKEAMPTRVSGLKGRQKVGSWQKPNPTITANAGFYAGAHYHPELNKPRRFTVRECARIQSFPDNFVFYGSLSAQYRQVGNAVPPRLANALANEIAKAFDLRA